MCICWFLLVFHKECSHSKNVGLAILYLHAAVSCLRIAGRLPVKICPALCGTRTFITVFTTASPRLYTKPENSTPHPYIMFKYKMYFNYALLNASGTLQAISYQRIFQIWSSVRICFFPVSVTCSGQLVFRRWQDGEESRYSCANVQNRRKRVPRRFGSNIEAKTGQYRLTNFRTPYGLLGG
jgi:hypothetical protein